MAAARDMELKLVNGMVLRVQLEEVAGGMGERVAELEALLAKQGDTLNALKGELAGVRRAMGRRDKEGTRGERGAAGPGNDASAEDNQFEQPPLGDLQRAELLTEVEGLKQQVEAARRATRDAVSAMKAEMYCLKEENARLRGTVEAQERAMAYSKENAEARMNEVELALAEPKDRRVRSDKERGGLRADERREGSCEQRAGADSREGKRRKREDVGKEGEMAGAAVGDCALIVVSGPSSEKRDEAEIEDKQQKEAKDNVLPLEPVGESELQKLTKRLEALEGTSAEGKRTWETIANLWTEAVPEETHLNLNGISYLSDAALTQLSSLQQLTHVNLNQSSGFTGEGLKWIFSLTGLAVLNLNTTSTIDADLEGIGKLKSLRALDVGNTGITDAGVANLQGLTALKSLTIGDCELVTSSSMVHVGKLTGLETLGLHNSGVKEEGLLHLTTLTSLKLLILPPGVTDSSMKHLRNMKRLEKLGLWDAKITAAGVKWLKGLTRLQKIGTETEVVEELIRDNFPGMVVTPGPL